MMTFHEAVSQLQLLEDDVLESHKAVLDSHTGWRQRHAQLLNVARDVDYDQDGTSQLLSYLADIATFTLLPLLYTVVFLWVQHVVGSGSPPAEGEL
jgi:hypothetical protein